MASTPTSTTSALAEREPGIAGIPVLRRLEVLLAVASVAVLFSNLAGYAFEALAGPRPSHVIAILCALGLVAVRLWPREFAALSENAVVGWAILYLAVSSLWMPWSEAIVGTWQVYADRFRSTGLLLVGLVAFSAPSARKWSRTALACLVVLATALNAVDLLAPMTFSQVAGRSAGWYINPNGSGLAIVFALALCLDGVHERLRVPIFLVGSAGVLMTLSRGALVLLLVLSAWFIASRRLSWKRLLLATSLLLGLAVTFEGIRDIGEAIDATGLVSDLAADRISIGASDFSADERQLVAAKALSLFEEAPLVGRGLGASLSWDGQSSHNLFLNMAVDHGVVGIALVVLLLLALWRCGPAAHLPTALVALSCLFSHNVLDAEYELLSIAFAAAAGVASRSAAEWQEEVPSV